MTSALTPLSCVKEAAQPQHIGVGRFRQTSNYREAGMYQSSRVSGQETITKAAQSVTVSAKDQLPQPGEIRVMKRNGAVVSFDATKIVVAMSKAFL